MYFGMVWRVVRKLNFTPPIARKPMVTVSSGSLGIVPAFRDISGIWVLGTLISYLYWGWNINRWRYYFHAVAEEIAHLFPFAQLLSCFKTVVFQPSLKVLCVAECLCSPWDMNLKYFSLFWEGNLAHISFFLVNVKSIIICQSTQHF